MKRLVLDSEGRQKTVAFCTALVALKIIGIDEFLSVVMMVDEAQTEDQGETHDVSEGFLTMLAEYHRTRPE